MPIALTADDTEFITLAEVKAHANIDADDTTHDDELDLFRGAAEEAVEGLIGPVLHREVTETHAAGNGSLVLRQWPVVSVASVGADSNPTLTFTAHLETGLLGSVWGYGPVSVTYTAGRTSVPDSVRVAALIIAEHLWKTQRGIAPSMFGDAEQPIPGMAYSIPNRAVDLLRPYLLPPTVA